MRTTFVAAVALASYANAFWGTGHLLVSRRAQAILEQEDPAALQAAVDALKPLQTYYPYLVVEDNHPFTECATFADNIKGQGYSWQSQWHFIDTPYLDDGGSISDYPDFVIETTDVVQALTALTNFLMDTGDYKDTTYYQQIAKAFGYEEDQKSFALRLIIHYVGDIHQPLHATSKVDNEFPKGDRGGNSEKVPSIDGAYNLHGIWDSIIYQYTGYPDLPLSDEDWAWYTTTVDEIAESHPVEVEDRHDGEFAVWAQESFDLSVNDVYPGFVEGEIPDEDYQAKAKEALESNMMLGARRLADLIMTIYGSQSNLFLQ